MAMVIDATGDLSQTTLLIAHAPVITFSTGQQNKCDLWYCNYCHPPANHENGICHIIHAIS